MLSTAGLNYSHFYQGRIDRSFCGEGPFCSLKQVLINAFSDIANALIVLDGYISIGNSIIFSGIWHKYHE